MSTAHIAQPRRPPGSQGAGEFTYKLHPEASVDIGDWASAGGSYEYPPYLTSAQSTAEFWLTKAEIPEDVLHSVSSAYEKRALDARKFGGPVPPPVSRVMMRPLVRMASMHWYAKDSLPDEEYRLLCERTQFNMPKVGAMTPAQVVDVYGLDELRFAFEPQLNVSDREFGINQVRDEIAGLREDLAYEG